MALGRYHESLGHYDGIGFVFSADDPYVGVDLDHVRDRRTGEIAEWAQTIIADLASYAEISPSGTGVKMICKGHLPIDGSGTRKPYESGAVEAYQYGRYFCLTGALLPGTPITIRRCPNALAKLCVTIGATSEKLKSAPPANESPAAVTATDDEILEKAAGGCQRPQIHHTMGGWSCRPAQSV